MDLDRNLLKVYELFEEEKDKRYYAIHTLDKLYSNSFQNIINFKVNLKLKIRPYLSDFSICPYLMLENLNDEKESEIVKIIFQEITTSIWKDKKFTPDIIKRLENPSKDKNFMENLIHTITSEKKNERFSEHSKAKELFYLYGEKEHLKLVIDKLELHSDLYHRFEEGRDSLED